MLIFDFDGTLADTSPFHEAAFNAVMEPWNLQVDYPSIAGQRTRDALSICFAEAGLNVPESKLQELILSKQAFARTLIQKDLQPLPGVDKFLRWARTRYRLALYSSGSRKTVTLAMEKLGYTGWFDPMLCAEDVTHTKPDPEGFVRVIKMAGICAERALVFEDSVSGVRAAQCAKLSTVCVSDTVREQDIPFIPLVAWAKIRTL